MPEQPVSSEVSYGIPLDAMSISLFFPLNDCKSFGHLIIWLEKLDYIRWFLSLTFPLEMPGQWIMHWEPEKSNVPWPRFSSFVILFAKEHDQLGTRRSLEALLWPL